MIEELINKIKYHPNDISHIKTALTHSSHANELDEDLEKNEKYEFLGDSILGFVTAKYLFSTFSDMNEGELTRLRAAIVCEKNLAKCAKKIELGKYIFLGKGEHLSKGYEKASILSDTLEALIGGIFLDSGIETANEFILDHIVKPFLNSKSGVDIGDYKSLFQEKMQKNGVVEIKYEVIEQTGPAHNMTFTIRVLVNGVLHGIGSGKTKKEAEQKAAKESFYLKEI